MLKSNVKLITPVAMCKKEFYLIKNNWLHFIILNNLFCSISCEDTLSVDVSGSVTCSDLNNYEAACNAVNAGSGKGANDLGCAYNS